MKKFLMDFKTFINKGNVVDMAVGVVIASAFGKITSSLVADIIMPLLSLATGSQNFTDHKLLLANEIKNQAGEVTRAAVYLNYGNFLQFIIDFFIIAFCIFIFIRVLNRSKKKAVGVLKNKQPETPPAPPKPPEPTTEEKLLIEIRDLLANKRD